MATPPIPHGVKERLFKGVLAQLSAVQNLDPDVDAKALAWVEQTWCLSKGDVQKAEEAVARLGGFSGAEVGVAAAEQLGGADAYDSMREIVARKLLLAPPVRPNFLMQIATVFKNDAKEALIEKFSEYGCKFDDEAVACLHSQETPAGERVTFDRAWMSSALEPHAIVLIGESRYVVDFKVALNDASPLDTATRNLYQMHAAKHFVEAHGLTVDGMILAKYRRDEDGFPEILPLEVAFDPLKTELVLDAGDRFWAMRCAGNLPDPARLPELTGDAAATLKEYADRFATFDAVASQAYRLGAESKDILMTGLSAASLPSGVHSLGAVSVQVTRQLDIGKAVSELGEASAASARIPSYSAKKMRTFLESHGVDMAQFIEPGIYDESRLRQMLEEKRLNVGSFERQSVSLGLDRRPNGLGQTLKGLAVAGVKAMQEQLLPVARQDATVKRQAAPRAAVASPAPSM